MSKHSASDVAEATTARQQSSASALSRRGFLQSAGTAAAGLSPPLTEAQTARAAPAAVLPSPSTSGTTLRAVTLHVNGVPHDLQLEPRVTLLDALRERLAFTGTKKGCDRGKPGNGQNRVQRPHQHLDMLQMPLRRLSAPQAASDQRTDFIQ